ncbi:hypothetical protein [Bacillus cereus group sp. IBL03679]|uniref:hypothetical protein n=1 Tax=Bacillus cereus group sp. IBL03679 TaxID=3240095 RepID=UPI003D2F7EB2
MNEQLGVKTAYVVMVGNLFIGNETPLVISKHVKGAKEFPYDLAKKTAADFDGVVVRKTVEYEVVINR